MTPNLRQDFDTERRIAAALGGKFSAAATLEVQAPAYEIDVPHNDGGMA